MTHPSRVKGNVYETEVVKELTALGFDVRKVPLSGSLGGEFSHDLRLFTDGGMKTIECKRREKMGLAEFYNWLAKGPNYLFLRRSRSDTLVVMTLREFAALMNGPAPHEEPHD